MRTTKHTRFAPRYTLAGALLLAVAVFVAYSPALRGGFIWDDNRLIVTNKLVKAANGLSRIWFSTEPIDYWPMTNSSFWLEWRLWGTDPTGYHLANLLLHIASSLVVWAILRKLEIPGSFFAALLFAVHPMNVESVAWIAQRKNTLSLFFFLLSILWYLRAQENRSPEARKQRRLGRWYWLSLLAFTLALLSKGSVAALPLVLLGLAWWQRGSIRPADVARALPFFVVAVVLVAVNIWFQKHGKEVVIRDVTLPQRVAGAGAVIWFYLSKAYLPVDLIFVYPQMNVRADHATWWAPLFAACITTAVLLWRGCRPATGLSRALLFAWAFFCVTLLPVLGLTDVYFMRYSLVANHYAYISLIGAAALAAAAWCFWHGRSTGASRQVSVAGAVIVTATLAMLTFLQSRTYQDAITVFQDTLDKNPNSWMAHVNLGAEFSNSGNQEKAIEQYQVALRIDPASTEAHAGLGNSLLAAGKLDDARRHLEQALAQRPELAAARLNLAISLYRAGELAESAAQLKQIVTSHPDFPDARDLLGTVLLASGRPEQAIEQFRQVIDLRSDLDQPHYDPRVLPQAHINLALSFDQAGRLPEAIEQYRESLRLNPDQPQVENNLGNALMKEGRAAEAIESYRRALQRRPNYVEAWSNLARSYAAVQDADEAITAAQKAIELAGQQGRGAVAQQIEQWLSEYRAQQKSN